MSNYLVFNYYLHYYTNNTNITTKMPELKWFKSNPGDVTIYLNSGLHYSSIINTNDFPRLSLSFTFAVIGINA